MDPHPTNPTTAAQVIHALIQRNSSDRGRLEKVVAENAALRRQLSETMARSFHRPGAKGNWTAADVMNKIAAGAINDVVTALNGELEMAEDQELAKAVEAALGALDRSDALDLLEEAEHREYDTPAPPPGPIVRRMQNILPVFDPVPPEKIEEAARQPVKLDVMMPEEIPPSTIRKLSAEDLVAILGPLPEGATGWDQDSKKPIFPLRESDLALVSRKKPSDVSTNPTDSNEHIEAPM